MTLHFRLAVYVLFWFTAAGIRPRAMADDTGLVAHWKLAGDALDASGNAHHGIAHHVDLDTATFNGTSGYIEVPDAPALHFGKGDFTVSAAVFTHADLRDVVGDLVTKYDSTWRRGFNLTMNASAPGYNAPANTRHLFFGIDQDDAGHWVDCGAPGRSTHSSDALTVFNGDLYAGTSDGPRESDWAHVYCYRGAGEWGDCGRLGTGRTRGVYAMTVHRGALYAATSATHGPQPKGLDFGRVYRYEGGTHWDDIGQPGENLRLHSLASFRGKLYATGFNIGPEPGHCYVYEGNSQWKECGKFQGWPCPLTVHDNRLYTGNPQAGVYAFDGSQWEDLGNPFQHWQECQQIHSLGVHRGELYAGSWPKGKVAVRRHGKWVDLGRLGDATEVVALTVYNGALLSGTIPRAEIFRLDGDRWTSLRRLFDPPGFEPVPVGSGAKEVEDWSRASSLAVFQGKLFCSTATCYRTMLELPREGEVRGKVFSYSTGAAVSLDRDLGPGWRHVIAVRAGHAMKLYVDGELASQVGVDTSTFDVSSTAPLYIGFGPQAHFHGRIRDVRLYNRALSDGEIMALSKTLTAKQPGDR